MSDPSYKNRRLALHGGEVSDERGYDVVLRHLETLPEQGSFPAADGISNFEGVGRYRRGCYHVHIHHYEGYFRRK